MPTMKSYVGSSVNIKKRFATHKQLLKSKEHWISYFQNSWNKYGESAFEFHVIEYCAKEKLIEREQFYLDVFQTVKYGFNLNPLAASTMGYKQTKETCENNARAKKKQFGDPIFIEKYRRMMASDEWKRKHLQGISTPECKTLKSKKGKERYTNPIERIKQSERIKATWKNPAIREKRIVGLNKHDVIIKSSERMKRVMSNPEARKHLSEMATRQFADPEARRKMSVLKKAQSSDPEFRLKQSMRNAKFSKEEVRKIRILLALKVTPNSLTRMFRCSDGVISNIKNNKILAYRGVA